MLAVGISGGSSASIYAYNGSELLKPSRSLNEDLKEPITLRLDASEGYTELDYRAQDQITHLISDATQDVYASQHSLYLSLLPKEDTETEETDEDSTIPEEGMSTSSEDTQSSVQPYANADNSEVEGILSFGLTSEQASVRSYDSSSEEE